MGSKICMNASCGTTSTLEWKKGWPLRSGGLADLCYRCGSAYEGSLFCDTFHLEQSGWRECYLCGKRLHCGCIASKLLVELLDYGGVGCTTCANCYQLNLNKRSENPDVFGRLTIKPLADRQANNGESGILGNNIDGGRLSRLCQVVEANAPDLFSQSQSQRGDSQMLLGRAKREDFVPHCGLAKILKPESTRSTLETGDMHELLSQPSLSMSLAVTPSGPSLSSGVLDGKEQINASSSPRLQRSCPTLPKPSKSAVATPSGTSKAAASQMRSARPPVEGRGKNHLLPRYWPRITDQELQQISGELNSNVVPLFEKVLSASDAGRIGRLVLPKACAEAYFPAINQSEGIPLRIQDVKGKEWTFQFRFWPNNNSRMYVLEGVTPCIQSMQLQAGDTVTFSRIDPGGKLVMGFRKAAKFGEQQGLQASGLTNGLSGEDTSSSGVTENPSSKNGSSGLFQIPKEAKGPSEHLSSPDVDIELQKSENNGGRTSDDSPQVKERKRTRNIGIKNKRLLLHNEEAMELRLTWEEAQDLLRPPPSTKPTIVTIEQHEFEEYDEPPVFGKRTVFTSRPSGGQDQWAQCDDCSKWRRLPVDALLPSRWTCSENAWDVGRCSCSAAEETSVKEMENFLRVGRDMKKRRSGESRRGGTAQEASGLDALASAAVLGERLGENGEAEAVATTTRHPRHRPGCTCIVCIQPPSGKGKHKPNCSCNVCMTVKRRFKTLMLRKKKRQLEREGAEEREEKGERRREGESSSTGGIDLNSDPLWNNREEAERRRGGMEDEGGHPKPQGIVAAGEAEKGSNTESAASAG